MLKVISNKIILTKTMTCKYLIYCLQTLLCALVIYNADEL